MGNIDFYLGASQPVSIIQDDVVLEHVVLKSNPLYDVRQVEVLRGPQGSLFGRNTTAGIIKFDTNRPTDTFQGRAQVSYGSLNTITADAGVGGPLIDGVLSFRLSGLYQHRDDWVDNTYAGPSADGTVSPQKDAMGGFTERAARLQLLLTPADGLSILGNLHGRWYDGTSTIFHRAGLRRGSNNVDNTPRFSVALDEAHNNPQGYDGWGGSVHVDMDLGPVTLTTITAYESTDGYSRGDTDGGAGSYFPVGGVPNGFGQSEGRVQDLDQWTQEIRLASNGDGPFKWQVGAFYFDQRDITDFRQRGVFLLPTNAGYNPNNWVRLRNSNTSWAGFGQVSYAFTPEFSLTAGARWTRDTKETRLLRANANAAGVSTYAGARYVRLSDGEPSWDLSALWHATPEIDVYARVARGFRGPTIQGRSAVFNADFTTANSETLTSYELGLRTRVFDDTLRFNASVFTYRVKDIQLNGNDSFGNGVLFNADSARATGLEADLTWRPVRNLTISAGFSYLDSEIRDRNALAQVCALNGVVVCDVLDPTVAITGRGVFAHIDGNPLPNAPKYNANVSLNYAHPVGETGEVFFGTDWNIQGRTNLVLYDTREFYANGNFEGDVRLGYRNTAHNYEVSLFARNVTNEKNLKGVIENYMAAVFNEPRIFGISLSASFN
jgi:iron complex outermembrane receptor protein